MQEIRRKLRLGRTAMNKLEKILRYKDVSLATKIQIIHTIIFPITMHGCKSWNVKNADEKKGDLKWKIL